MVVVAIMGILIGMASLSVSLIFSSEAMKCADSLDAALSRCRISAMSRAADVGDVYLAIRVTDKGVTAEYAEKGKTSITEQVGGSRVSVSYNTADGTPTDLDTSNALYLTFKRDTGALVTLDSLDPTKDASAQCTQITVTGGGHSYVITLVPATGAHYIGATP